MKTKQLKVYNKENKNIANPSANNLHELSIQLKQLIPKSILP